MTERRNVAHSPGLSPLAAAPEDVGGTIQSPKTEPAISASPETPTGGLFSARHRDRSDLAFHSLTTASGALVVLVIVLIAIFLLVQAIPSLLANHANFLTSTEFVTSDVTDLRFGIRDLLVVTVMSALFALLIAVPIAIGIALFVTQYAPKVLARPFSSLIDLLAAVPSIVYGLWGILVFAPILTPFAQFLNSALGWFPLFAKGNVSIAGGGTIFTAGIVLAIMILPIITAVTREVFRQTPRSSIEAALALGATKWEVIRLTVIPFGRSGTIAASMLGLGRALGETVAVLIILRTSAQAASLTLFDGGYTFASKIASAAAEFSAPLSTGAYIAAGFVLFVLTFIVNALARLIASRSARA
jgi:phosphate transport system permease protein